MGSNKLMEVEITRGIAILGVLLIHSTSDAVVDISAGSRSQIVYLAINKMANFSVPVFIFLSGLVLCYRYCQSWSGKQCISFYKNRLQSTIIPYFFWSVIYYCYNHPISVHTEEAFSSREFIHQFMFGTAAYHLYFVVLIVQYYILFPLFLRLTHYSQKNSMKYLTAFIAVLVPVILQLLNRYYSWTSDMSSIFTTYLDAFYIGCWIGLQYQEFFAFIQKHKNMLFSFTALLFLFHITNSELVNRGIPLNPIYSQAVVHLYSIGMGTGLLAVLKNLHSNLLLPRVVKILSLYGKLSLGVYFIHPLFLSIYKHFLATPANSLKYHAFTAGGLILLLTIPVVVTFYLKKIKYGWVMFGR